MVCKASLHCISVNVLCWGLHTPSVTKWMLFFFKVVTIILGNKTDLQDYRQVDPEMASQWARGEKVKLWEVTVANRQTLLEPFTLLASKLNQIQSKSLFLPGKGKVKGTPSSDN